MQPSENDVYFPHKEAALELEAKQRLLEDLAARVGLEVCYEPMDTGRRRSSAGGLCRLRSQLLVLIDEGAPRVEQIGVLLDALSQFDVEAMFVPPDAPAGAGSEEALTGLAVVCMSSPLGA